MAIRKCPICGGIVLQETPGHFVCTCCGQEQEYDDLTNAANDALEKIKNLEQDLLKSLKASRINLADIKTGTKNLIDADYKNQIAIFVSKYLESNHFPENYKTAISSLVEVKDEEQFKILLDFIIKNSDYKYMDTIQELVKTKGIEDPYNEIIRNRCIKLEEENENFANIHRDVFVCYSSEDINDVRRIVKALKDDGNTVWYSDVNLPKNSSVENEYWTRIENAIEKCSLFLFVGSNNSRLSRDCNKELELAEKHKIKNRVEYIIKSIKNTSQLKQFFDGIQWIDASQNEQLEVLNKRVFDLLHPVKKEEVKVEKPAISKENPVKPPLNSQKPNVKSSKTDYKTNTYSNRNNESEPEVFIKPKLNIAGQDKEKFKLAMCDEQSKKNFNKKALKYFFVGNYDGAYHYIAGHKSYVAFASPLVCFYLYKMYRYGIKIDRDYEKAEEYFNKLISTLTDPCYEDTLDDTYYLIAKEAIELSVYYLNKKHKQEQTKDEIFKRIKLLMNHSIRHVKKNNPSRFKFLQVIRQLYGVDTPKNIKCAFSVLNSLKTPEYLKDIYFFDTIYYFSLMLEYKAVNEDNEDKRKSYFQTALKGYQAAEQTHDPKVYLKIAQYYFSGKPGIEPDQQKAFNYIQLAADFGNVDAICMLAYYYREGIGGVKKDPIKAQLYYTKAYNYGSIKAKEYLESMNENK